MTPEAERVHPSAKVAGPQRRITYMNGTTLMTIPEACAALKVSRGFVYQLQKRGLLELVKLGRASRVRAADVARIAQTGAK